MVRAPAIPQKRKESAARRASIPSSHLCSCVGWEKSIGLVHPYVVLVVERGGVRELLLELPDCIDILLIMEREGVGVIDEDVVRALLLLPVVDDEVPLREHPHPFHLCRVIDRKSTRLNSSHSQISYAVFCLKKK